MIETIVQAGLLIPLVGLFSLLIGSFLNVVIHRTPKMMENELRLDCEWLAAKDAGQPEPDFVEPSTPDYNWVTPRSTCPSCDTPIASRDNVPVLSWLLLKGACRQCRHPISPRYPLVEALTAGLGMVTVAVLGADGLVYLPLVYALVALTAIDLDTQLLPDQLTLPLLWLGLIVAALGWTPISLEAAVWGAVGGFLSLWSVFHVFKLLTGKHGMGAGDFKLLAALGAWLGWSQLPLVIILSSLVGAVVGVTAIALAKMGAKAPMAFGPYLAGAGLIALLWGPGLVDGYLSYAGF